MADWQPAWLERVWASAPRRLEASHNQLMYGTANAGRDAFEAGVADLTAFQRRWPEQLAQLITARHPPEGAPDLLLRPPPGIKQVVSFAKK